MSSVETQFDDAKARLNQHLSTTSISKELQSIASVIKAQVDEIRKTTPQIPITTLVIVLDTVALTVADPTPENALACWNAGQDLLTYKEPVARTLGQNLLLMAGVSCFVAAVTLIAISGTVSTPASAALFLASKIALEASESVSTTNSSHDKLKICSDECRFRDIIAEFKACLSELKITTDSVQKNESINNRPV